MERLASNKSDDMYDSDSTQMPDDEWTDEMDLSTFQLNQVNGAEETELDPKEKEIDAIWNDIFLSDSDKRKEELFLATEYQGLQKEVLELKSLNAEKDAKISNLTSQIMNLKKNICSLYKTAKSEADQKDTLLNEANKKLDRILWKRSFGTPDERQMPYSEFPNSKVTERNNRSQSMQTQVLNETLQNLRDSSSTEDQRSYSISHQHGIKQDFPSQRSTKVNSNQKVPQVARRFEDQCTQTDNDVLEFSSPVQDPDLARETKRTNDVFFNLLPVELKQSFLGYEKSQIAMLNQLKQSFVSHHFTQCVNETANSNDNSSPATQSSKNPDSANGDILDSKVTYISLPLKKKPEVSETGNIPERNSGVRNKSNSVKAAAKAEKFPCSVRDDIRTLRQYRNAKLPSKVERQTGASEKGNRKKSS